ncbi:ArsR/SmtB family transcription factor [Parahaliea mediterranea]|uniref:Metalloregulator ArsR/SmtB family transcription factor n=1 Tax=Parahaliea mediterranea TaxID=651086 RepID=A0A939DIX9_9GAMM|nr:metalloregulator ArsR/SmtB family transcription factor [Parahaliea mediterranea]MBN7798985.1 metalloregulator ArsR/SmtB family transcription factor [Parahaliea mediterranea]
MDAHQVFSVLANETRLRCLNLVLRYDEICVCELVDTLGISQPTVSKALSALKQAGILADRRDARWTYYRKNPAMPEWIGAIVSSTLRHLRHLEPYRGDSDRFVPQMAMGGGGKCAV